jgi:hypothetical protein
VLRYDGDAKWTSLRRLFDPPGYEPVPVGSGDKRVEDWSRASSLTVFDGKLFASTATCYRTRIADAPADDVRGKVYSLEVGANVTHDRDLGTGWKHLAAVRSATELQLFVDGRRVAAKRIAGETYNLTCDAPLRIGSGASDSFHGRLRDVRVYDRALSAEDVSGLASGK